MKESLEFPQNNKDEGHFGEDDFIPADISAQLKSDLEKIERGEGLAQTPDQVKELKETIREVIKNSGEAA